MPKAGPGRVAIFCAIGLCVQLLVAASASAQGDPDANWLPGFQAPGMDGTVNAACEYQGDLIAGGTFRTIGAQIIEHVARWDGVAWHPLGAGLDGDVTQMAVYRDAVIAMGDFAGVGGASRSYIVSFNGTAWVPLGPELDKTPSSLAVYHDTLFVAGPFVLAGDVEVPGVARWDGTAWHATVPMHGPQEPGTPALLAVAGDRLFGVWVPQPGLYAEGVSFPVIWQDGTWVPLPDGHAPDALPTMMPARLAVLGDTLLAAGTYTGTIAGEAVEGLYVARWTGAEWIPLGHAWRDDPGLIIGHDGSIYLARSGALYRWDGSDWNIVTHPAGADIKALFSIHGDLLIGGRVIDGAFRAHGIASWDGRVWRALGAQAGNGLNDWRGSPNVVLANAGDGFVAGGTFRSAGNETAFGLSQWNGDSWISLPSTSGEFRQNAFLDLDGRITTVFDETLGEGSRIRWLRGSTWKDIAWLSAPVLCLTPWRNRLVAGGSFPPGRIVVTPQIVTNPDEVTDPLGPGLNGSVISTCTVEGSVIASGTFTATADGSVPLNRIARWDGEAWLALGDGLPEPALRLQPFAGGVAAAVGNDVLHWDGERWSHLGPSFNQPVLALAVYKGELVAGGAFTLDAMDRTGGLARWRSGRWEPIGSGMNGEVQDLEANGDVLWVGGSFTAAGIVPSSGVAGWSEHRTPALDFVTRLQGDSVAVSWRDSATDPPGFTAVRWSRDAYPVDPLDGFALPAPYAGPFPATAGGVHTFRLAFPRDGSHLYFSAFSVHLDGGTAAPQHDDVQFPDLQPPVIALTARPVVGRDAQLSVTVHSGERLAPAAISARLDSTVIALSAADATGRLWRGSPVIENAGSFRLTVCARDSLGNEACTERGVGVGRLGPDSPGQCADPGRSIGLDWRAGTFAAAGSMMLVVDRDSGQVSCEIGADQEPRQPLVLSFLIRPGDPGSDNPLRLGVTGPDGSIEGGIYDAAGGRLEFQASALGIYRLAPAEDELSRPADPRFLELAPAAPNPFSAGTALGIELRSRQNVRVTVYDVQGRSVAVLLDAAAGPGTEVVRWDGRRHEEAGVGDAGRSVPSGAYFVRVQTAVATRVVRVVKVR